MKTIFTARLQKVVIPCLLLEFSIVIFCEQLGLTMPEMGWGIQLVGTWEEGGRVRAEQDMEA